MVSYKLIKGEKSAKNRSRGIIGAAKKLLKWFKR